MKEQHRIFVAIPFDAPTRCLYEALLESGEIQSHYPGHKIIFEFGDKVIGPIESGLKNRDVQSAESQHT